MNKTQEALRMAIEALAEFEWIKESKYKKAIQACKAALEQPSMSYEQGFAHGYEAHRAEQPKEWVGLTTKQLEQLEEKSYLLQTGVNDYEFDFIHFARNIEAKLKELNHAI